MSQDWMNFDIEWNYIWALEPKVYEKYAGCNKRNRGFMQTEIRSHRSRTALFRGTKPAIAIYAYAIPPNGIMPYTPEPWILGSGFFSSYAFYVYVKQHWRGIGIGSAILDKAWELNDELDYHIDPKEMKLP